MNCRFCQTELEYEFIDLGSSPPSNSFIDQSELNYSELFFPLRVFVCPTCFLVQIDEYKNKQEIFNKDYIYFSSYSKSWLEHAKSYVAMITNRLMLNDKSLVMEIASNDGYLLQYFKERAIPCIGIDPASGAGDVARKKGIETITAFFGEKFAKEFTIKNQLADLIIGNNVLAHVPDICDFVCGLKICLKRNGVITMEFPHLLRLITENQFDTIYHEHYSYLSLYTVRNIFDAHGLHVFDVDQLSTHGGSIRIYAQHDKNRNIHTSNRIEKLLELEETFGLNQISSYQNFQKSAEMIKYNLLSFLIEQKQKGNLVAAYGAAAKGNTLLNYSGIKKDLIPFVVDASPHKQGKYLPGSHIPVVGEEEIRKREPDYILILPWNIKDEIVEQLHYVRNWNGKFVIAIPTLQFV